VRKVEKAGGQSWLSKVGPQKTNPFITLMHVMNNIIWAYEF